MARELDVEMKQHRQALFVVAPLPSDQIGARQESQPNWTCARRCQPWKKLTQHPSHTSVRIVFWQPNMSLIHFSQSEEQRKVQPLR